MSKSFSQRSGVDPALGDAPASMIVEALWLHVESAEGSRLDSGFFLQLKLPLEGTRRSCEPQLSLCRMALLCRKAGLDAELQKKQAEATVAFERERYRALDEAHQAQARELEGLRQRHLEFAVSVTEFQKQLRTKEQATQDAQDGARRLDIQVSTRHDMRNLSKCSLFAFHSLNMCTTGQGKEDSFCARALLVPACFAPASPRLSVAGHGEGVREGPSPPPLGRSCPSVLQLLLQLADRSLRLCGSGLVQAYLGCQLFLVLLLLLREVLLDKGRKRA